jgi:hypothetical protein
MPEGEPLSYRSAPPEQSLIVIDGEPAPVLAYLREQGWRVLGRVSEGWLVERS